MSRIVPVITGIGLVTPLGSSAGQTWSALMDGQFIRDHARVNPEATASSRAGAMASSAAREALCGTPAPDALVVGTSKGSIENWISRRHPVTPVAGRDDGAYGLSDIACDIAREFSIDGPRLTLSAACASGLHALIRGAMMIQSGQAHRVMVVATEASVHPLFIGSFKRLGVLPPEGHGCRPLDQTRGGFLMSEAAAAVCLEVLSDERKAMRAHPSLIAHRPSLIIDRFSLGGDATHLTGGDAEARTLRHLLDRAIGGRSVDLVHAHATGTTLNDATELAAVEATAPSSPNVYSHKGALGHSLGAAGLVSVVLNVMMHQRGIILPNVRTERPISSRLPICRHAVNRNVSRSIAIASGFGGPTAVVCLASQ